MLKRLLEANKNQISFFYAKLFWENKRSFGSLNMLKICHQISKVFMELEEQDPITKKY